jgi:hypothetical protein
MAIYPTYMIGEMIGNGVIIEESVGNPDALKRSASVTVEWHGANSVLLKNAVADFLRDLRDNRAAHQPQTARNPPRKIGDQAEFNGKLYECTDLLPDGSASWEIVPHQPPSRCPRCQSQVANDRQWCASCGETSPASREGGGE